MGTQISQPTTTTFENPYPNVIILSSNVSDRLNNLVDQQQPDTCVEVEESGVLGELDSNSNNAMISDQSFEQSASPLPDPDPVYPVLETPRDESFVPVLETPRDESFVPVLETPRDELFVPVKEQIEDVGAIGASGDAKKEREQKPRIKKARKSKAKATTTRDKCLLGVDSHGSLFIETISAHQARADLQKKLVDNDMEWFERMKSLEERYYGTIAQELEQYEWTRRSLDQLLPRVQENRCVDWSMKIGECYAQNSEQSLKCGELIQEYARCVASLTSVTNASGDADVEGVKVVKVRPVEGRGGYYISSSFQNDVDASYNSSPKTKTASASNSASFFAAA